MADEKAPANFRDYRHLYEFQFKTLGDNLEKMAKSLEDCRIEIRTDLESIKKDVVGLKIKSAIWGATAAFILSVISHCIPLGSLPDTQLKEVQKQLMGTVNAEQSH